MLPIILMLHYIQWDNTFQCKLNGKNRKTLCIFFTEVKRFLIGAENLVHVKEIDGLFSKLHLVIC